MPEEDSLKKRGSAARTLIGVLALSGLPLSALQLAPAPVPPEAPRITMDEVKALQKKGEVVIVDVRTKEGFGVGHADGAVNIPLAELGVRMKELPKGKAIVAYCT